MSQTEKTKNDFIKIYDETADALFRHCFFRVSDREKAKDLVQETFSKTWEHAVNKGDIVNLKAFLYKVANNLIIDYYRKNKDQSLDNLMEKGFDSSSGDNKIVSNAEYSKVVEVIKKLGLRDKEVIIMRFLDDLSIKEISNILEISENAVSVRLNRAMGRLRKEMKIYE